MSDQNEWALKFWDDLVNGPVVLRFNVTDKEKAKRQIAEWFMTDGKPPDGLHMTEIIIRDTTSAAKSMIADLRAVFDKYREHFS